MEVLSRPARVFASPDMTDDEPSPGPSMLAAPSSVTRSPPRLPSVDHILTIPVRPSIVSRRHSATVSPMSPSHLSRPLRSSPLAGPSIAASSDNPHAAAASAPPTPGGGTRHLSPLAESSNTILAEALPVVDTEVKKQRRRSLGAVLSKLSFPANAPVPSTSEPVSPVTPPTPTRRRTKSTTSQEAPPVPPVPTWVHNTMPARTRSPASPHASPSSPLSSRGHASPLHASTPKSSRPTSPTPSARSAASSLTPGTDPRRASLRPPPSTSRSPEENWLTQSAAPRFSRLGLKAEGVILPVSAREARRRSTASLASINGSKARSSDMLPPRPPPIPIPARTSSRASTASYGSLPGPRPSTAPASQQHFRSRTSSRASLASAASASGSAMESGSMYYCDTPSLTMSPGPSASDVSLNSSRAPTVAGADEMGVLSISQAFPLPHTLAHAHTLPVAHSNPHVHAPSTPGSVVEIQLNDVPVGVLTVPVPAPAPAYMRAGKGKPRATDIVALVAPPDDLPPWARRARSPSLASSAATSVVDLSRPGALHARAATAPEAADCAKAKKKPHALGRMWGRVVRSVTTRR